MCKHEGFYSCVGRYDRRAGRLVYLMVCDDCQEVLQPVAEQPYQPHFVDRLARSGDPGHGAEPQAA